MERDRRTSPIRMAKVTMRSSLANFNKAEELQCPNHLARFENQQTRHRLFHSLSTAEYLVVLQLWS